MSIKVNIDNDVLDSAKFVASKVDDIYLRKRAYALGIAANATAKFLNDKGLKTQSNHSLYRSAVFAKEIEIADIYANNARFDVRVTFNNKTFTVPKLHIKYNIKPQAYIVVKFDSSLKDIEFLGFIPSEELTFDKNGDDYYNYPLDILKPFEEFITYAQELNIQNHPYNEQEHESVKALCLGFIDEEASEADKIYFIKHVAECSVCRETFCDMNDFDDIVSQLKNYHELLNDSTLSVLSGNKKEVDQAAIANMAFVENAGEDLPEEEAEKLEEIFPSASAQPVLAPDNSLDELAPEILNMYDEPSELTEEPVNEDAFEKISEAPEQQANLVKEMYSPQEETAQQLIELENEQDDSFPLNEEPETIMLEMQENEPLLEKHFEISENQELEPIGQAVEETYSEPVQNIKEEAEIIEPLLDDSFDDLNASIDAFASEPVVEIESEETDLEELSLTAEKEQVQTDEYIKESTSKDINEEISENTLVEDNIDSAISEIDSDSVLEDIELEELNTDDTEIIEEITSQVPETERLVLDEGSESIVQEGSDEPAEVDLPEFEDEPIMQEESEDGIAIDAEQEKLDVLNNYSEPDAIENESDEDSNLDFEEKEEKVDTALPVADFQEQEPDELKYSADTLELSDLETLDSLEPMEELTELEEFTDLNEEQEEVKTEQIPQILDDEGEFVAPSTPQQPVELKYDDIEETNAPISVQFIEEQQPVELHKESYDVNRQQPVIDALEDEIQEHSADLTVPDYQEQETKELHMQDHDFKLDEPMQASFDTTSQNMEQMQKNEQKTEEDDLQGLLDDDLLALLSDDDSNISTDEKVEPNEEPSLQDSEGDVDEATVEAAEINQENGEIENLFEEHEALQDGEHVELDLSQEPISAEAVKKTKKLAVSAALITLLAIGGAAGGWYMYQKNAAINNDSIDTAQDNQVFDFQNKGSESEKTDTSSAAVSQDINKSMTNSFSDKPAAISITKLSWQVSEKLAVEPSVKEYLQTAGKNIQLNLQNDLANAADVAFNNSVKVSFEIAPDNTMKGIQVLESSGSDKIDETITKSIRNTLKYVSVPKLKNYNSDYFLTLIINF